jgi:hypothetical protein
MSPWLVDIESFEQVSQDDSSRTLVLRLARLFREGRLAPFMTSMAEDPGFDDDTRSAVTELACDATFLLAVEDYLERTRVAH